MQIIKLTGGVCMPRDIVETIVELLIEALNRADGDPDLEPNNDAEPNGDEQDIDYRNAPPIPSDPVTGFHLIRDEEGKAYPF